MRKAYLTIVTTLLILFLSGGCKTYMAEEDCASYDYSNCQTTQPTEAALHIKLTVDDQHPAVPVTVYSGRFEDGEVVWQDTLTESDYSVYVGLDVYYTVTALYISNQDTILAIDGDHVRSSSETICDSICWTVSEGYTDVRLKNTP